MSVRFWNRTAKKYAQQPIRDEKNYQKKLTLTRKYFTSDSVALEFGSGTGSTALLHAPYVAHYTAIDSSPAMTEIAEQKRCAQGIENVSFQCGEVYDHSDGSAASLDAVLALNVLHLMPDHERAIDFSANLLKPGGVFVSSTVCAELSVWNPLRWILTVAGKTGLIPKLVFIPQSQLRALIEAAGLTIVEEFEQQTGFGPFTALFLIARR